MREGYVFVRTGCVQRSWRSKFVRVTKKGISFALNEKGKQTAWEWDGVVSVSSGPPPSGRVGLGPTVTIAIGGSNIAFAVKIDQNLGLKLTQIHY